MKYFISDMQYSNSVWIKYNDANFTIYEVNAVRKKKERMPIRYSSIQERRTKQLKHSISYQDEADL